MAAKHDETSLTVEQVYEATPEEVFDAWIDPEMLNRWFVGGEATHLSTVQIDAREGGTYLIVMANEREEWVHDGEYLAFDRPGRLQFTWRTTYEGDRKSVVDIAIEAVDAMRTRIVLNHDVLVHESVEPHRKGWTELLEKLAVALD